MSDFAISLQNQVFNPENLNNLVTGPFSIYNALAILLLGSSSSTREKIISALKENSTSNVDDNLAQTIKLIENQKEGVTFLNSNGIFYEGGIKKEFLSDTINKYNAKVERVSFSSNPSGAVKAINDYTSKNTNEKIKEIIDVSLISVLTRMVIVNAVYLKGDWKTQFDKKLTSNLKFFKDDGTEVMTSFMKGKIDVPYGHFDDLGCEAIMMPFKDSEFRCVVILPLEKKSLNKLYETLKDNNGESFKKILKGENLYEMKTNIKIPKFKIGYSLDLKESMAKLGIGEIFSDGADFSNMSDDGLYVSEFVHKAVFEMNEEGAEAVAATAMAMNFRSLPITTDFFANHPFIFGIVSKEGFPIFLGHIMDPTVEV